MRSLLFGLAALAAPALLSAQAPAPSTPPAVPAAALDPKQALPRDPAVRTGKLPNGMTFYVRHNARPEKRVALRLAVDAGSILEADDQRGLAHFVEHMAFNGSKNFESGELVKFLESIGARFGADANAYTSFDETVYMLDVPTDREDLVKRALLALSDFAGRATMSAEEIDKERGIVLEEWRQGQGASMRVLRQQLPALFHGSRYAERLPIGEPETLKGFAHDRLRAFYREWYHPELMAIVAVGDIDPAAMEAEIRKAFDDVRPAGPAPNRPVHPVPAHPQTLYSVATDPEVTGSMVSVSWKHPLEPQGTVGDYQRSLLQNLFHQMVNERLDELARRPDAPFLQASSSGGGLGKDVETYSLSARVAEGRVSDGLRALLVESRRLREHGFVAAELDRARRNMLAFYDRAWRERDKSESSSYAREYTSNFLTDEPFPGIEFEREIARAWLPSVTLAQLKDLAARLIREDSRVVLATLPERQDVPKPTEAALRGVVEAVQKVAVTPWTEQLADRPLVKTPPPPGKVTSRRELAEIGVTVLTLSNGAEVWLKPTDFKNDQVLFSAQAFGGASLAPREQLAEARLSAIAVAESGIADLSPTDLEKLLAGRLVNMTPYVGSFTHGLNGSSTPGDLETALQLAYLEMTAPRHDPQAESVLRARLAEIVAQRRNDPAAVYRDAVQQLNTGGHPLFAPLEPQDVEKADFGRAVDYYKARFANAADFTFFLTGAFDREKVVPLVEAWLASLPSTGARRTAFDAGALRFPEGTPERTVSLGREPLSLTTITFRSPAGLDVAERHRARAAAAILRNQLRTILREEKGQTYSPSVGWSAEDPADFATITASFGSAPENADEMVKTVLAEVERLQKEGPPPGSLANEQEIQRRELEVAQRQNGWWQGIMQSARLLGADPVMIVQGARGRIDALTPQVVQEALRRHLPLDRNTRVRLQPAAGVAAGK
jgi:zinc protease